MLPSVKLNTPGEPTTVAVKFITVSLCENGAGEAPRYQEMVGTGLPEELQAMLTESPSRTVTVPVRFLVVGTPGAKNIYIYFHRLLIQMSWLHYYWAILYPTQDTQLYCCCKKVCSPHNDSETV